MMYLCVLDLNFARGFLSLSLQSLYLWGARHDGERGFPYGQCGMGCEEVNAIGRAFRCSGLRGVQEEIGLCSHLGIA